MRKFLLNLAAGAMIVSGTAVAPGAAVAAPATDDLAFCKSLNPDPQSGGSLGDCMSLFTTFRLENDGLPTQVCRFWDATGQLDDFGYSSFTECVRTEHYFFNQP